MTAPTAHLTTSLTWDYQDWRGRDRSADVEVEYTCDADGWVNITRLTGESLSDDQIDALCDYIAAEIAPQEYAEWLAEYVASLDLGLAA